MRGSPSVTDPPSQIIDPAGSDQLPQRPPMRLPKQRPRIDDTVVLEYSCSRSIPRVKRHQPHAPQPNGELVGGRVPPLQTLNIEP